MRRYWTLGDDVLMPMTREMRFGGGNLNNELKGLLLVQDEIPGKQRGVICWSTGSSKIECPRS